jgi:hypothetical protein
VAPGRAKRRTPADAWRQAARVGALVIEGGAGERHHHGERR